MAGRVVGWKKEGQSYGWREFISIYLVYNTVVHEQAAEKGPLSA